MQCSKCKQFFDLLCANFTEAAYMSLSAEFKACWICVECRCGMPKGDNSGTPVRSIHLIHDASMTSDCHDISMSSLDHVTTRTGARTARLNNDNISTEPLDSALNNIRVAIVHEMKELHDLFENRVMAKLHKMLADHYNSLQTELLSQVGNLSERVEALERKVDTLQDLMSKLPSHSSTIKASDSLALLVSSDTSPVDEQRPGLQIEKYRNDASKSKSTMNIHKRGKKSEANGSHLKSPAPVLNPLPTQSTQLPSTDADINKNMEARDWTVVTRKNKRYSLPTVLRGTATPGSTMLEASERWQYLHLYYVKQGTSEAQIQEHLKNITASDLCTVEVLKSRGRYASFKIGAPARLSAAILAPENWAEDICIKLWRQSFRNRGENRD